MPSSAEFYHFRYELDAFLSAARSITSLPVERGKNDSWYLEKEFGHRPGFQTWYDEKVDEFKADKSIRFMNDERANAVHFNYQSSRTRAEMKRTIPTTASLTSTVTNSEGSTEGVSPQLDGTPENPPEKFPECRWYFDTDQIMGDKTVIVACEEHLRKLEYIVDEVERL